MLALLFVVNCMVMIVRGHDTEDYLNEWAVEIPGGLRVARDVADTHGFDLVRQFDSLPNHYLFKRKDVPHRSRRSVRRHTENLNADNRVLYAQQQDQLTRHKREAKSSFDVREVVARKGILDDPEYVHQWYLNPVDVQPDYNSDLSSNNVSSHLTDIKVREVWKLGVSGKNVVVTILDDGIEKDHPDLINNYDPLASTDLNDNDGDPSPRYESTNENKHGTRCGGVISMAANNNVCGAGIAFDSKLGGVRILDGAITDILECAAISLKPDYIHIYSASWGPKDNGKVVDGPRKFTKAAIEKGVKEGRGGKGSIFVWASGNGGYNDDNCNADGYTSSIETISVSSSSQTGKSPNYAEKCASTLTTAYSSSSPSEGKVVSTDLHNKCTDHHTGTSAASPMVVGIVALLLEVNPNVTWRDVQHLIVHTSRQEPLANNIGWYSNAAGYCVNLAFGFGLVDALAIVQLANSSKWKSVGEQIICRIQPSNINVLPIKFQSGQYVEVEFNVTKWPCPGKEINTLEHIQMVADIEHERRGNIYVEVQSGMGTVTPLMLERKLDNSIKGFNHWPFMSTHSWGEHPLGIWKLRVADRSNQNLTGHLKNVTLVLYGTEKKPDYIIGSMLQKCVPSPGHHKNHSSWMLSSKRVN